MSNCSWARGLANAVAVGAVPEVVGVGDVVEDVAGAEEEEVVAVVVAVGEAAAVVAARMALVALQT